MVLTVPFERWLAAGCPDEYDYDGMQVDADWIISVEHESIHEGGESVLDDNACEQLGLPLGSTNVDAIRELRKRWPLDIQPPPGSS